MSESHNLRVLTGIDICTGPNHSFVPGETMTPSLIDHILIGETFVPYVQKYYIAEDAPLNVSRHLPVFMELKITPKVDMNCLSSESFVKQCFNWSSLDHRERYSTEIANTLINTSFNYENIDETYTTICNCLLSASDKCVKKRTFKKYLKPYWSSVIEKYHKNMVEARIDWLRNNSPRNGITYDNYKNYKRIFRSELRKASQIYERNEYERIDKLAELDQNGFWKAIKSKKRGKKGSSNGNEIRFKQNIETHPDQILDGWCNYFSELYSFSNNDCFDETFRQNIEKEVKNQTFANNSNYITQCLLGN